MKKSKIVLGIIFFFWYVSLSYAEDYISKENRYLLWLLGGAFSIIQILVGYIYVSGINSIKTSVRTIFSHIDELQKEKLSKNDHRELCDRTQKK